MLKKILLGFAALFLLAVVVVGWRVWPIYQLTREISPSTAPEDYAEQDDSRVEIPTPLELEPRAAGPLKNVYWGELQPSPGCGPCWSATSIPVATPDRDVHSGRGSNRMTSRGAKPIKA
jgi:hypothetical protein